MLTPKFKCLTSLGEIQSFVVHTRDPREVAGDMVHNRLDNARLGKGFSGWSKAKSELDQRLAAPRGNRTLRQRLEVPPRTGFGHHLVARMISRAAFDSGTRAGSATAKPGTPRRHAGLELGGQFRHGDVRLLLDASDQERSIRLELAGARWTALPLRRNRARATMARHQLAHPGETGRIAWTP